MLKRFAKYVVAALSAELVAYGGGKAADKLLTESSLIIWLVTAAFGIAGLIFSFLWWSRDERLRSLEVCYNELCKYTGVTPSSDGVTPLEIEASDRLMPHMRKFCYTLDHYNIPHPALDENAVIVFSNTGKWVSFMSRIIACGISVRKMRKVAREFMKTHV